MVQKFPSRVALGLGKFDRISQGQRSLTWLFNDLVLKFKCVNVLVLEFKCVNGLAPDYLCKYFLNVQQFTTRTQRDVKILWSLEVDCQ